jgi:hypothetical protein
MPPRIGTFGFARHTKPTRRQNQKSQISEAIANANRIVMMLLVNFYSRTPLKK